MIAGILQRIRFARATLIFLFLYLVLFSKYKVGRMSDQQPEHIVVFEQRGSGQKKVQGMKEFGGEQFSIRTVDISEDLPELIDNPEDYLPQNIEADLVLDYMTHPDLSHELARICREQEVPLIASGKKHQDGWSHTPPICCALTKNAACGNYSRLFGYPEYKVWLKEGRIEDIQVVRGAPCGATWRTIQELIGMPAHEAAIALGLKTQFHCTANPAGWDPIGGKSPVHLAGDVHCAALKLAIYKAQKSGSLDQERTCRISCHET